MAKVRRVLEINAKNPQDKFIDEVVACLKVGGVIIYPTDTVYGIGCDIHNAKAVERVCQIKKVKPNKQLFSFVCNDLSHISEYTKNVSTPAFKAMKKGFPGPFTFILEAGNKVPKLLQNTRKTVGIRVPNNAISRAIVEKLGNPLLSSSLKSEDEDGIREYLTEPDEILEQYGHLVDIVIDGGAGLATASTVILATNGDLEIIREGLGDAEEIM